MLKNNASKNRKIRLKKIKKNKWGEKKREFISFLIHIVFKNTS